MEKQTQAKFKRSSPFRIKVGCVVALRYRPGGNNITLIEETQTGTENGTTTNTKTSKNTAKQDANHKQKKKVKQLQLQQQQYSFSEVWTDPQPGRDEGLALIGSRVRCCFPKVVLSESFTPRATSRFLEGEVVAIVDYTMQYSLQRRAARRRQRQQAKEESCRTGTGTGTRVDLLIDRDQIKALPFLSRIDADVDPSTLSGSAKREYINEQKIRGPNKAIVRVVLCSTNIDTSNNNNSLEAQWVIRKRVPTTPLLQQEQKRYKKQEMNKNRRDTTASITTKPKTDQQDMDLSSISPEDHRHSKRELSLALEDNNNKNNDSHSKLDQSDRSNVTKQQQQQQKEDENQTTTYEPVQKKRKLTNTTKTNLKKDYSSPKYLGDGNDSTIQQEANWRWQASRYYPFAFLKQPYNRLNSTLLIHLAYNFVGRVLKIEPCHQSTTSTNTNNNDNANGSFQTLAMVTIQRLVLPEHTEQGRMPFHGVHEIFQDADDSCLTRAFPTSSCMESKNQNDTTARTSTFTDSKSNYYYRVPVEELVIISKKLNRQPSTTTDSSVSLLQENNNYDNNNTTNSELQMARSYSFSSNSFFYIKDAFKDNNYDDSLDVCICSRCRRVTTPLKKVPGSPNNNNNNNNDTILHCICDSCKVVLDKVKSLYWGSQGKDNNNGDANEDDEDSSYSYLFCDCQVCRDKCDAERQAHFFRVAARAGKRLERINGRNATTALTTGSSSISDMGFPNARAMIKLMNRSSSFVDFGLVPDFLPFATPSSKPVVRVKSRSPRTKKQGSVVESASASGLTEAKSSKEKSSGAVVAAGGTSSWKDSNNQEATPTIEFKPTCSRLLPYSMGRRKVNIFESQLMIGPNETSRTTQKKDKPRNLRLSCQNNNNDNTARLLEKEEKSDSRAVRAHQRRLLRDVAAIGFSLDALAGREQQLRFDRSDIHAWGVFADDEIKEGELIIEYRGEIIGNSMAEKREKEYEAAKIGSDYMFRIDGATVCDATKQGNVARFINASCDPNCFTKIISIDGNKRIVVYAKRDIAAGEELCYDYKFPLEYDESKRIRCCCGSRDCRGFMNWDKRYAMQQKEKELEGANGTRKNGQQCIDDSSGRQNECS